MIKEPLYDVIIIGGGQSALACAYYLRRTDLDYIILDAQSECGGTWQKAWNSLTLFSTAQHSSLPGWLMPKSKNPFPTRNEVIDYLCQYEKRYNFPVRRPFKVKNVMKQDDVFRVETDKESFFTKALIAATGTWSKPHIPEIDGINDYSGHQIHSAYYKSPNHLRGNKVLIVGEGNSGAQIMAEVSKSHQAKWATLKEPEFLPPDIDGKVLFDVASAKYYAEKKGEEFDPSKLNLGNIVRTPSVKEAEKRGVLKSSGSIKRLNKKGVIWENERQEAFDNIIWCTGFHFATSYLSNLVKLDGRGKTKTKGTRSIQERGLWLVGFGGWTGFASATLIGVGRSAKKTINEVEQFLNNNLKS